MIMPVMQVGKMGMGMMNFFVFVETDMPTGNRGNMVMSMMKVIMPVPMDVLTVDMPVIMRMFLKDQGCDRNGQNQSSHYLNPGKLLRKQQHREKRAKKRRARKQDLTPGCTQTMGRRDVKHYA
jgi:hypothetical protein